MSAPMPDAVEKGAWTPGPWRFDHDWHRIPMHTAVELFWGGSYRGKRPRRETVAKRIESFLSSLPGPQP